MRDDKVTIAKGIGILLMVAAHAGIPDVISRFIVMIHMPVSFPHLTLTTRDLAEISVVAHSLNKKQVIYAVSTETT